MRIKKGFTLIELMIVVAIIAILATVILVSINQSRKNSRINGAKTSLKTVLPAIISCKDGGGNVTERVGGTDICSSGGLDGARWPALSYGYAYGAGTYNSSDCTFSVSTNGDRAADIACSCATQTCN